MKVKGTLTADIVGLSIKRNKSHDGREAFVDLDIGVLHDTAASTWGEDFSDLAFSTMHVAEGELDGEDHVAFLVDSIKPNNHVVFERHRIEIRAEGEEHEGEVIDVQPELLTIRTQNGVRRVIARVRLPIDVGRTALLSALSAKVGATIKLIVDPTQASFAFVAKGDAPSEQNADEPDGDEEVEDDDDLEPASDNGVDEELAQEAAQ